MFPQRSWAVRAWAMLLGKAVVPCIGISISEGHSLPVWIIGGWEESQQWGFLLIRHGGEGSLRDWLEKQQMMEFALGICRAFLTTFVMIEHASYGGWIKYVFQGKMRTSKKRLRRCQGYWLETFIVLHDVALLGHLPSGDITDCCFHTGSYHVWAEPEGSKHLWTCKSWMEPQATGFEKSGEKKKRKLESFSQLFQMSMLPTICCYTVRGGRF